MARRTTDFSLITAATTHTRHPRFALGLTMLFLLAGVLFVVFGILPEGSIERLRPGRANRMFQKATALESQSLYRSAADAYAAILANSRLDSRVRYRSALRLARLQQDELSEPKTAEAVLEQAWQLAPGKEDQKAVAAHIESLRGRPIEPTTLTLVTAQTMLRSDAAAQAQRREHRTVVAQVGGESITVEDLMFAWSQTHGGPPDSSEDFGPFVKNYLDLALLADEAHRRGLDDRGRAALELRMNRIVSLAKTMNELFIENLPNPTESQLRAEYAAHPTDWAAPCREKLGHIVVTDKGKVEAVRRALADGENFADVAREHSLDAKELPEGCILGTISENDETLPHIGHQPGLAPLLCAMDDGATTGPIKLARGYHWFKVLEKHPAGEPAPFDSVRDRVAYRYQAGQLARVRAALLDRLRASRPIVLHRDALEKMARPAQQVPKVSIPSAPTTITAATAEAAAADKPATHGQTANE